MRGCATTVLGVDCICFIGPCPIIRTDCYLMISPGDGPVTTTPFHDKLLRMAVELP
jgi:hypothetical protein